MPNILVGERWKQDRNGAICYVEGFTDMGEVVSIRFPVTPNSKPKRELMCKRTFLLFFSRAPEDKPVKLRTQWERLIED
jgi:hypothetical protein